MRRLASVLLLALFFRPALPAPPAFPAPPALPGLLVQGGFTVDQILSLPTPDNLIASPVGARIAWTFNERGVRNIYMADGPDFQPHRLTSYMEDDGQELSNLSFSPDGGTIVYVRGGDHGSNRPGDAPNPSGNPNQPKMQVWSIQVAGGPARLLGEGDEPVVAPDGKRVAFVKERRIWLAPIDGSKRAAAAFFARGASESPSWSPDGRTLAFVSNRGDHSFIGLFTPDQSIRFLAPSTSRDSSPIWSPGGERIAFVRQPGAGGTPRAPLVQPRLPWAIVIVGVNASATDDRAVTTAITSGDNSIDPILQNPGGLRMWWGAADALVFMSYRDGFPHLYSIANPGKASKPLSITSGSFMVEHVTLTPDRRIAVYTANAGSDPSDFDRRHLFSVSVTAPTPRPLTSGTGIEWSPVITGDGRTVAYLSADARRPPIPAVVPLEGGAPRLIAMEHIPADFPTTQLVTPEPVSFTASDGVEAHGQLFLPIGGNGTAGRMARKPAIVYVHGGGPRQMLLGWHNRWEYANDYGANQYLASRGFVVLSVDYRLSVGYGQAFQFPEKAGPRGASEYLDILAAGRYLQKRPDVDPRRIGVWGASYGGYLTALALGRNSDVFAAGVDIHGVHDRLPAVNATQLAHALVGDGITEADLRQALKIQFESSPISAVGTWKSPVLLIHGDDDRTVDFRQTVDLGRRLRDKGVKVEELVLPDDVHDSLLWRNWTQTISAMAEFFERTLKLTDERRER
jgi:dipeptidyl aminopeptidase/acylaminoacyl peptidase